MSAYRTAEHHVVRELLQNAESAYDSKPGLLPPEGEFHFTLPELVELASAQDYAPGCPAEGIVIRPVEEARSRILESGRLSAKVISERYALKHGE